MLLGTVAPASVSAAEQDNTIKLRILETSDTHTHLFSYDYYKGAANDKLGLLKVASAVKQARGEVANSVLVDGGDTIQGTPLGTYFATVDPVGDDGVHPVIQAFNAMQYDAVTLGNHEFNYGLDYQGKTYGKADFPYLSANVYKDDGDGNPDNDELMFRPYSIQDKVVTDESGNEQTIKIGYIGFVPPQIMMWDKGHLEGKVITKGIVESAEKYVPEMKEKGADVIIAITHSGFDKDAVPENPEEENAVLPLSLVDGVDAIAFGHGHDVFPAAPGGTLASKFMDGDQALASINPEKGTINGVPAVEAGYGGEYLGVIDLAIEPDGDGWKVADGQSSVRPVIGFDEDPELKQALQEAHDKVIEYTNRKLGTTTAPIYSYFALVQDDPSVQIVTDAQKAYAKEFIKLNKPEYADTPILSAGAPFKAGGRNGVTEYTDIPEGDLTIRSAGDLYLHDNTLKAILLKGSELRDYIDRSAANFNQIDPASDKKQPLLNPDFRSYNFDIVDGVTYQIDVTKPAKYDAGGKLINADSTRVADLKFEGKPVKDDQEFVLVMNNYRQSGGGYFPHVKDAPLIVDSAEENRQVLMDYIKDQGEINPAADNNWSIAPLEGNPDVTFISSPAAEKYTTDAGHITYTGKKDKDGFGIFTIDLGKKDIPAPEPIISFKDVGPDHWAKSYIDHLSSMKVIKGYPDGTFKPEKQITRGQFMSMTVRSLGLSDSSTPFNDELAIAIEKGITVKTAENFGSAVPISREQMAAMIVRAYNVKTGKEHEASKMPDYPDFDKVAPWFKDEVALAHELGLMTGEPSRNFNPKGQAKRSHAAKVISLSTQK